jgi:quercetin dioxygenase-like cupin family protein
MDRKIALSALLAAACLWPVAVPAQVESPAVKSETLLKTSSAWNNAPYAAYSAGAPEITVLRITIPARATLPWHTHPMPNAAYVVSGEVTVETRDGAKRLFGTGEVIPETVDTVHRGTAGDQPAVLLVFYAGVKGMPLSQKAP